MAAKDGVYHEFKMEINMKGLHNKGLATVGYLLYIIVPFIIGMATVQVTKKVDSPLEQMAEQVLRMEGQEVDFSAHLKRQPDGKIMATDAKAVTTKLPQPYVYDSNVDSKLGTYYSR